LVGLSCGFIRCFLWLSYTCSSAANTDVGDMRGVVGVAFTSTPGEGGDG
jgi:hypothetical protein